MFEQDEHGNWVDGSDTEREATWAEYYKESGEGEPAPAEAAAETPESDS